MSGSPRPPALDSRSFFMTREAREPKPTKIFVGRCLMNNANKRGLGKGLGALIPQGSVFTGGRTILNIDPENIVANPRQPRTHFSKEALHDLCESIKEQGVIEPILVRMRD